MRKLREYIKVKSLTFWSGAVPIMTGMFIALDPVHGLVEWTLAVQEITGNVPAYIQINAGLAAIGLRRAMDD